MTPTLQTKRLTLVPFLAGMVENWHVAWLNDPEVVRYSEQRHRRHTIESQHTYLNEHTGFVWLIRLGPGQSIRIDEGRMSRGIWDMGTITAYLDGANLTANLGILIKKESWGKGYGLEAWNAVLRWCKEVGVKKVECGCWVDNEPMKILAERSGMNFEATIPSHFRDDSGDRVDAVLYGVSL